MKLSEEEFNLTFTSRFLNVSETAENFKTKEFDDYVNNNLIEELGIMRIEYIYDTVDGNWRHVIFETEIKNMQYVIVINMKSECIKGHHVLDLNEKYGL